jgi:hypothetical protein
VKILSDWMDINKDLVLLLELFVILAILLLIIVSNNLVNPLIIMGENAASTVHDQRVPNILDGAHKFVLKYNSTLTN